MDPKEEKYDVDYHIDNRHDDGHVLMLTNNEKYDVHCAMCSQRCSGLTFNCLGCPLHAHKRCLSGPPKRFKSPYHPHVLILQSGWRRIKCNACYTERDYHKRHYYCGECVLCFDIECALLVKADVDEDQIQLPIHLHPLSHGSKGGDDIKVLNCKACDKSCSGKAYYYCNHCKFFLHKSCAKLPKELAISFQRYKINLCLVTWPKKFTCVVCGDERQGFSYERGEGSLKMKMDVECSLAIHQSQAQLSNLDEVYFTFHLHPLIFRDKIENGIECICKACDKKICSGPTYGCSSCKYFLHISCTEPKQITHLYHPHPLKLVYYWPFIVTCQLCDQDLTGAFYACTNGCDFALDIECSSIKSIIEFQGHPHPLVFCEKFCRKVKCILCRTSTDLSIFRCVDNGCNKHYNLDLLCGPLPHNIKSRHMHVLDLHEYYLEDDTGEDSCDVCEKRRNPQEPCYLCRICKDQDCAYVAEIKCVMPEIVKALRGDLGAVELRTVRTRIPGRVIPALGEQQDDDHEEVKMNAPARAKEEVDEDYRWSQLLYHGLTKYEQKKLVVLWDDVERSLSGRKYRKLSDVIQYSDDAFMLFMENLRSYSDWHHVCPYGFNDEDKLVTVAGNYKILRSLVPIYEDLVDKHGDISEDCEFSPLGKSFLYVYLLSVICTMGNKQVSNVTEVDLQSCHTFLKGLRFAGFRIQFAVENLMNKLARAYFGLQLVKFGPDRLHDLDQQIEEHSEAIEEQEAKLQVIQPQLEEHVRRMRAKKSSLMNKCWSEGRALKYKVG